MSPYERDINTFVVACETLLNVNMVAVDLSAKERRIIQYYISALTAKFPALLK